MSWSTYKARATRRGFLQGMGAGLGSLLLAPTVGSLLAQASGAGSRKRLVIVVEGNGFYGFSRWDRLTMSSPRIEPLGPLSESLPQVAALEPWRDQLVAMNGLANKQGFGQHAGHRGHYYATTCLPYLGGSRPGGPSIDAVISRGLPDDRAFPVLRLAAGGSPGSPGGNSPAVTATAPGFAAAHQHDPREAWRTLFGVASPDPAERAAFDERAVLMDYLRDDANRVMSQLGGEERWKMERYLYTLESFEREHDLLLRRVGDIEARGPDYPAGSFDVLDVCDFTELQMNLAAGALITNLTDVVVLSVAAANSCFSAFNNWGFGGRHSMGHGGGGTESRPAGIAGLVQTHNEIARCIARLIRTLESVPEGDGTMWDNSAVVFLNDNGSEHHSKYDNFPVVTVGTLGGALGGGGTLIEYPNYRQSGTRGLGQFWNTISTAMGVELNDFGKGGAAPHEGPLTELLP